MNAKPHWLSQLGDFKVHGRVTAEKVAALGVDKLLPGRSWRPGFVVGVSQRAGRESA